HGALVAESLTRRRPVIHIGGRAHVDAVGGAIATDAIVPPAGAKTPVISCFFGEFSLAIAVYFAMRSTLRHGGSDDQQGQRSRGHRLHSPRHRARTPLRRRA